MTAPDVPPGTRTSGSLVQHQQSVVRKTVTVATVDVTGTSRAVVTWADGTNSDTGFPWIGGYLPRVGDVALLDLVKGSPLLVGVITPDVDVWHTVGAGGEPAFGTNWSNTGGSNRKAGFRRTADGHVELCGWVQTSAGVTAPSTIFTLPVGYRPDANAIIGRTAGNSGGGQVAVSVLVNANGTVQLTSYGGSVQWANVGLDGVNVALVGSA